MVKVSVVIPVYNVEPYLRQCLDSVVGQTLEDIEVICVDDGSTDNSLKILHEYEQRDSRVKVLTQRNQYAGVARNTGLEHAVGEYIIFWDADDYFANKALEKMYTLAKEKDADLCICDAQDFDTETGERLAHNYIRKPLPDKEIFSIYDFKPYIYTFTSTVSWNKLIRRQLMMEEKIRFQSLQHINDVLAALLVLSFAKRIVLCKEKLIFYRMNRKDSLMGTYSSQNDAVLQAYGETGRILREKGFLDDPEIRQSFYNKALGVYLFTMVYSNSFAQFAELYDEMKNKNFCQMGMDAMPEDYIYSKAQARKYASIQNNPAEEYMFQEYQIMTRDYNGLRYQNRVLKRKQERAMEKVRLLKKEKKEAERRWKKEVEKNRHKDKLLRLRSVRFALFVSKFLGKLMFWKR